MNMNIKFKRKTIEEKERKKLLFYPSDAEEVKNRRHENGTKTKRTAQCIVNAR